MALKVSLKPKTEAVTQQARLESTDIRSILLKTDQSLKQTPRERGVV